MRYLFLLSLPLCAAAALASDNQEHAIHINYLPRRQGYKGQAIQRSPSFDNIRQAIDGDSTPSSEPDAVADLMLASYFRDNGKAIRDRIRPYMLQKLQERQDELSQIEDACTRHSYDFHEIIAHAVEHAMQQQELQLRAEIDRARDELPRARVACITGTATVVAAVISAGVTLAVSLLS